MSSVKVANQVLSHRVRVKCHTDIHGQSSLADGLFGTVQRPFVHPQAAHWQQDHWGEKPIELNPLESIMNKALSQIKNHAMTGVSVDYLAQFYESTAVQLYDRIVEKIRELAKFPEVYHDRQFHQVYRRMADKYLGFYAVRDGAIEIHRILHGSRDIHRYLDKD